MASSGPSSDETAMLCAWQSCTPTPHSFPSDQVTFRSTELLERAVNHSASQPVRAAMRTWQHGHIMVGKGWKGHWERELRRLVVAVGKLRLAAALEQVRLQLVFLQCHGCAVRLRWPCSTHSVLRNGSMQPTSFCMLSACSGSVPRPNANTLPAALVCDGLH